ncbi:hypothetical protein QE152_g35643 [Popillia japonica]|uniref:Uncharacterized protein n=1 Tax=Popillia japonica TaxID=7064 RepID=A0AAW1IFR3_POPJA
MQFRPDQAVEYAPAERQKRCYFNPPCAQHHLPYILLIRDYVTLSEISDKRIFRIKSAGPSQYPDIPLLIRDYVTLSEISDKRIFRIKSAGPSQYPDIPASRPRHPHPPPPPTSPLILIKF